MAFDQLDSSNVPDHIQAALTNPNEFLFDFTNADLISPTNGVDKSESRFDISEETKTSFYMLIEAYLVILRKKDEDGHPAEHSISRYTATARRPDVFTAAPTCAPTSLSFQNLPFVMKDGDEALPEPVLEGENTMLVYLQMTDGHKMPNTLLAPSANGVMPPLDETSKLSDGALCLSKASFRGGFR